MRIVATSKIGDASQNEFGTVDMSAYPNPTRGSVFHNDRGACIEYRCPGLVIDNGNYIYDLSTVVEVHLVVTDQSLICRMR